MPPVAASSATSRPLALATGRPRPRRYGRSRCRARRGRRPGRRPARPRRPSASGRRRRAPGRRSRGAAAAARCRCRCSPTVALPHASLRRRGPTRSRARPCPRRSRASRPPTLREDRRRLEVVVADVVRRHLVVPEQPPGARVEHEQRVGVERRAREDAAVRPPACRPTAPGSSCRRRARPSSSTETGYQSPPPPGLDG